MTASKKDSHFFQQTSTQMFGARISGKYVFKVMIYKVLEKSTDRNLQSTIR